jgi:hypothetical protein
VLAVKRLRTAMTALRNYIEGQSAHLVNYSLRHRQGRPIGASTTELSGQPADEQTSANAMVRQRRAHGHHRASAVFQFI